MLDNTSNKEKHRLSWFCLEFTRFYLCRGCYRDPKNSFPFFWCWYCNYKHIQYIYIYVDISCIPFSLSLSLHCHLYVHIYLHTQKIFSNFPNFHGEEWWNNPPQPAAPYRGIPVACPGRSDAPATSCHSMGCPAQAVQLPSRERPGCLGHGFSGCSGQIQFKPTQAYFSMFVN